MRKTYGYTVVTLLFAFLFAFGSMAGSALILRARERQLLTQRGEAVAESPVRAWQEEQGGSDGQSEPDGGNAEAVTAEKYALTQEQMEDVINCWTRREGILMHNPVSGQISMEEAVDAGEEWLDRMEIGVGAEISSVNAALGVAKRKESDNSQLEPYYSFWIVQLSGRSLRAELYVNAVTGRVWNAELTLYEDLPESIPNEKLESFLELAGVQMSDGDVVDVLVVDQEGIRSFCRDADSRIYAEMIFFRSQNDKYYDLEEWGGMLEEYDGDGDYREKVRILMTLKAGR